MSGASESSTAPVTTTDDTSGSSTAVATSDSSGSGSSTTAADGTTGGGWCTVDLPPPPGCAYVAEPGLVAHRQAPSGWGDHEELLPDEAQGGGGFIADPDGGAPDECDTFAQNCPGGEKCMPWADDGGNSWNATRCSPIADDPGAIGDPCTVEGSAVSGIDDCELGAMCFGVDGDTQMGHCIEQCSCNEVTPVCNTPNTSCVITNQGVLALCLPVCNPLDPEACESGSGCFGAGDLFHCAPDASGAGGAPGDECSFLNACDPGSFCASPASVPGCAGSVGCCSSLCPLSGVADCLDGQNCVAWFGDGAPDACLGEVGACTAQ
jgi:hypothetical protein